MMSKRLLVLLVGGMILAAMPVRADLCMKQATHSDAFEIMGQKQPEKFDTTVMWVGEKRSRTNLGDTASMLFDMEKSELYALNHTQKTYAVIPLDLGKMVDEALQGETGEEAEAAKATMEAAMSSMKCEVTPTEETKKIGEWNTRKYNVAMSIMMMNFNNEVWATQDIKFDWKAYYALTEGLLSQMPGAENIVKEMAKVDGVPVMSITTGDMMGTTFKSTTELFECTTKDAPAGTYDIPADYKQVEMSGMGGF